MEEEENAERSTSNAQRSVEEEANAQRSIEEKDNVQRSTSNAQRSTEEEANAERSTPNAQHRILKSAASFCVFLGRSNAGYEDSD
jgi:cell fate (sporulation/competence/biofilm development) regulator YlbF (YheA/YmcA/DUF963 family)